VSTLENIIITIVSIGIVSLFIKPFFHFNYLKSIGHIEKEMTIFELNRKVFKYLFLNISLMIPFYKRYSTKHFETNNPKAKSNLIITKILVYMFWLGMFLAVIHHFLFDSIK